jgi:hypothetical protein
MSLLAQLQAANAADAPLTLETTASLLYAPQHSAEPCYLRPPCMFGESVILGDDMPTFRVRPWTMRTRGIVRLWELRLTDLWPIMRMWVLIS